jgi:DNA integrity scanning protein DisA with diadenylate cyclase activity
MLEKKIPEGELVKNSVSEAKKALQKAKYAIVADVVEEAKSGSESLKKIRKSAESEGIEVKKESISSLLGLESKIEISKGEIEYEQLKEASKSPKGDKELPKEGGKI